MIITKEHQESWVNAYVKEKHTTDECIHVGRSFYVIKIHKELQDKINIHLFKPTIYRFVERSVVSDYLGYCNNWTSWYLPKKLHNKNLKIVSCDKTQITVAW